MTTYNKGSMRRPDKIISIGPDPIKKLKKKKVHDLIGKYVVITTTQQGVPIDLVTAETDIDFVGNSIPECQKWLVDNCVEEYGSQDDGPAGEDNNWGSDVVICKIEKVCRQIPIVHVAAKVKDVW